MPTPSPFVATVRESNRQGRDAWARFEPHRARVSSLLASRATQQSSLCILGAGNLNDVSLERMLEAFATVHLVDLDVDAVASALERQGMTGNPAVRVGAPLDLTGVLDRLPSTGPVASPALIRELVDVLGGHRCEIAGQPYGVTASTGVLTQLLQSVVDANLRGEDAERVAIALRDKHLADLVGITEPAGSFVIISDVVSTATAPHLLDVAPDALGTKLAALVAARNFFTGTNPYRIVALLEDDPRFQPAVLDVGLLDPWLWAVTDDRLHLTYAIVGRRR